MIHQTPHHPEGTRLQISFCRECKFGPCVIGNQSDKNNGSLDPPCLYSVAGEGIKKPVWHKMMDMRVSNYKEELSYD